MSKRSFSTFSPATLGKRSRGSEEDDLNNSNVEYRRIRKIVKLNIIKNGMSVQESIRQVKANSPPQIQMQMQQQQQQQQHMQQNYHHQQQQQQQQQEQMNVDNTTTTNTTTTTTTTTTSNYNNTPNIDQEVQDLWKILEQDLLEEIRLEQEMLQQQYEDQYANYANEAMMHDINSYHEPDANNNNNNNNNNTNNSNLMKPSVRYPHGVLCPVCQRRNLMQNGRIFFCGCGMRIDTQHDNITMDNVGDTLGQHINAHINKKCQATPQFYVTDRFGGGRGLQNLVMECQVCNTFEIVL